MPIDGEGDKPGEVDVGGSVTGGAWLAVQVMAHNLARWTARIGLGQQIVTTKTLNDGSLPWPAGSPARHAD